MITILRNNDISDYILFEAKDDEEIIGTLSCDIENGELIISDIQSTPFLVDGLCRTALNYALNRFINKCVFLTEGKPCHEQLLKLSFVQNGNNTIDDIDNFFTSHKNCNNQ